MKDERPDLNQRIAARLRALRTERALALAALADRSGVSRSMISLIERGESSPTAVILEKLASALGVALAALFEPGPPGAAAEPGPLCRRAEQLVWRDPASGYLRRNLTPPGRGDGLQLVEVKFPPGGRVAFDNTVRNGDWHQQIWLVAGRLDVTVGRVRHRLEVGDCLAMELDQPTLFHNPVKVPARYLVALRPRASSRS